MIKYLTTIAVVLYFNAASAQTEKSFVIKGTIKNANGKKIWLAKQGDHSEPIDSATLNSSGIFSLTMNAPEEARYHLMWKQDKNNGYFTFINDANLMNITGDMQDSKSFTVENSQLNNELKELTSFIDEKKTNYYSIYHKYDSLRSNKLLDSNLKKSYILQLEDIEAEQKDKLFSYLSGTSSPAFKWHILVGLAHLPSVISPYEIQYLLQQATKEYPQHKGLRSFADAITNIKKSYLENQNQTGKPFPSFSLPNTKNKIVSLTDFKGKYILVDFWASWCKPCREENPHLAEILKQFLNKNFTIVSISLDDHKNYWLEASIKDNITWTNLCDLKGMESPIAKQLNILSLPRNLLIDPQGAIIAINLYGEDLENKLKEVLK